MRNKKIYSDRGSLADLVDNQGTAEREPFTTEELRIKKLYDYAVSNNMEDLKSSLGFITIDGLGDKKSLPINIIKLREVINNIKLANAEEIKKMEDELSLLCWSNLPQYNLAKKASVKFPLFRRVIE